MNIKQKLERGETLVFEECRDFCDLIFENKVSKTELVEILNLINKDKFTSSMLAGFATSMREISVKVEADNNVIDNCGTGGDGSSTFNISTISSLIASCCGVKVAKHGNKSITSKSGSADVLNELGININMPTDRISQCLSQHNFAFMFAPLHHSAMRYVAEARKEISPNKTIFNLLGPLTNPAGARRQLIGVYSEDVMVAMAEALIKLGVERAMVIHSLDGLDEISIFDKTKILKIDNNNIQEEYFDPSDYFDITNYKLNDLKVSTPKESAQIIMNIVSDNQTGAALDIALTNAAFVLLVGKPELTFTEALDICKQKISDGSVKNQITKLVNFSNTG